MRRSALRTMVGIGLLCAAHPLAVLAGRPDRGNPLPKEVASRWQRALLRLRVGRRSPGAVVALLRLRRLLDIVPAERALADLRRVEEAGLHPLALFPLARSMAALRQLVGRRTEPGTWRRVGVPPSCLVLGPFEAEARAGLSKRLPPDEIRGVRTSQTYVSGGRSLRWVSLAVGATGCFEPQNRLRPVGGVAYLAAAFRVASPGLYVLRVGSEGPYALHLDGVDLGSHDNLARTLAADQDTWPVRLDRGWHILRVKLSASETSWGLCLRLTDAGGKPPRGLAWSADPDLLERTSAFLRGSRTRLAGEGDRRHVVSVYRWLRSRVDRQPDALEPRRQLVEYARAFRPEGLAEDVVRAWARELAERHPSWRTWTLVADTATGSDVLDALSRAAKLASGEKKGEILGAMAAWWLGQGRYSRAIRLHRLALREGWTGPRAMFQSVELAVAAGLNAHGLSLARQLVARYPWWPKGLSRIAQILMDLDRPGRAADTLLPVLSKRPGDVGLAVLAWEALRRAGRRREAEGVLRRLLAVRPEAVSLRAALADALSHWGRTSEAVRLLEAGLASTPSDTALLETLGRVYLRAGKIPEAKRLFAKLLAAEPQRDDLRQELAALEGRSSEPLAARYGLDPERVSHMRVEGARDAVVVWDRVVYVMQDNGSLSRFRHRFVRVLSRRGAARASTWTISYQPDAQVLRILAARVHRRDGSVVPAVGSVEQRVSDASVRIYYDWNELQLRFPKLRPGDLVELEYVLTDVASYQPFAGYLGLIEPLAEGMARHRFEVVVNVPAGKRLYFNRPRGVAVQHRLERRKGRSEHWWVVGPVAEAVSEPMSPGWSSVLPYLHVSTFRSWQDVARWYWHLVEPQYRADDRLRALARRLSRGKGTVEEKVRSVYRFVTRKIRYVGLEFGIHTHKPYPASEVLRRRFGDCKDKAMLMVVLLRQMGVEARSVLVRTRFNGDVASQPASLAVFDHAVVYVPALDRFLDGTAEDTGWDDLPYPDQGAAALVLERGSGRFVHIPVLPAERNRVHRTIRLRITASGKAVVREKLSMYGQVAARWRRRYRDSPNRKRLVEENLGRIFPGAVLDDLQIRGDTDPDQPLRLALRYRVPRLLQGRGESRVVPLGPLESRLLQRFAALEHRTTPVELDYPFVSQEEILVLLPRGVQVESLPRTVRFQQAKVGGSFFQEAKVVHGGLAIRRRLRLGRLRIPTDVYSLFRSFCARVDVALADQVILAWKRSGRRP